MLTPLKGLFWVIIREGAIFSPPIRRSAVACKKCGPALTYGILLSHWTKMATTETAREKALANYRKKLLEHRELDARLKESMDILLLCFVILFKFKWLMLFGIAVDFFGSNILCDEWHALWEYSYFFHFCLIFFCFSFCEGKIGHTCTNVSAGSEWSFMEIITYMCL